MIRAMTTVIIPALDESPGLASDQAQMVLGHLHVLREQLDHAGRFEDLEYRAAVSLAEALVAHAGDGSASPASQQLQAALAAGTGAHPQETRDRAEAIRAAVEEFVRTHPQDEHAARMQSIVLEHERTSANLNRSWFAAMGWDGADSGLPSIPEMIEDGLHATGKGAGA
jgi:hypothetical protein